MQARLNRAFYLGRRGTNYLRSNSRCLDQAVVFDVIKDKDITAYPLVVVRAGKATPLQYDVNVNFLIKNKIWLGASYRSAADISALIGLQINPQFSVNYSYDYALTKIQKYSQGSHEITIGYLFSYKQRKVVTPRYF